MSIKFVYKQQTQHIYHAPWRILEPLKWHPSKIYKQGNPDHLSSFANMRFYPVMTKDTSTLTNLLSHVTNKACEIIVNDCSHYVSIPVWKRGWLLLVPIITQRGKRLQYVICLSCTNTKLHTLRCNGCL